MDFWGFLFCLAPSSVISKINCLWDQHTSKSCVKSTQFIGPESQLTPLQLKTLHFLGIPSLPCDPESYLKQQAGYLWWSLCTFLLSGVGGGGGTGQCCAESSLRDRTYWLYRAEGGLGIPLTYSGRLVWHRAQHCGYKQKFHLCIFDCLWLIIECWLAKYNCCSSSHSLKKPKSYVSD